MGVILILVGTVLISFTKKGTDIAELPIGPKGERFVIFQEPLEGPALSILFGKYPTIIFSDYCDGMFWRKRAYSEVHGNQTWH